MCKLSLTAGFCLIIASLGLPGLAKGPPKPPQNPCFGRSDGLYRNPNDQYSYYSCVGGQLSIVKCPSNSQYLPTQKVCDYPRDTEPTTTDNGNFCYGKPNGQYSNPNDLHSFISCVDGKDHILQCPSDLVYVQSKNACDYPTTHHGNFCLGKTDGRYTNPYDKTSFYSCVGGKLSIENCPPNWVYIPDKSDCQYPAQTTDTHNGNFCHGRPDGLYAYALDQHSYYRCASGITYYLQCPSGLVYVPSKKVCDHPDQTTGTHNGNFCQGRPDGLYTNPDDKHSFYQCASGITYIQPCPSGLVYEPSKKVCDYPAQTTDGHNGIFCYGKPDGQYSNPNDLHSFISCVDGITYTLQCPSDLVYVQSKNACDYPTTHHGNFCLGKTDGRYTNPYDKTSFYSCVGGKLSIENCPSNLVYIPDKSDCQYPAQTTNTHNGNFCHGRPDGLYTYPLDQHSYYSCASGITYYLQCPSGLVYVPSKKVCDYH